MNHNLTDQIARALELCPVLDLGEPRYSGGWDLLQEVDEHVQCIAVISDEVAYALMAWHWREKLWEAGWTFHTNGTEYWLEGESERKALGPYLTYLEALAAAIVAVFGEKEN